MIRNHWHTDKRSAFTLVEMMVVLLIIAILMSLGLSISVNVMGKITEVQTRTEISEMEVALRAFMTDYDLATPPPSTLVLSEIAPLSTTSSNFLQKVFGKTLGAGQPYVDWNGNGVPDATPWILEGEQCLVFYLGGIPTAPGVTGFAPQGFSTNNMNPAMPGGKRKGPYYIFQTPRLVPIQVVNPTATLLSSFHPAYIDAWQVKVTLNPTSPPFPVHPAPLRNGIPYAYFSSQGLNNGYTLTDCASIGAAPYFVIPTNPLAAVQYMYPNEYQIISAGRNGTFGTTGWVPAVGAAIPGNDDEANFSSTLLGLGQN